MSSFADGFDRLIGLNPQEIQVGILKRLRGTPIIRHNDEFKMVYSPRAPYEILQNSTLDFATLQRLRRFGRYWDLLGNSGNFIRTLPLLWEGTADSAQSAVRSEGANEQAGIEGSARSPASPFWSFWKFSEWLFETGARRTHAIALPRLAELLFTYLTGNAALDPKPVALMLAEDYTRSARREIPGFLREHLPDDYAVAPREARTASAPRRQARHLQQTTGPVEN